MNLVKRNACGKSVESQLLNFLASWHLCIYKYITCIVFLHTHLVLYCRFQIYDIRLTRAVFAVALSFVHPTKWRSITRCSNTCLFSHHVRFKSLIPIKIFLQVGISVYLHTHLILYCRFQIYDSTDILGPCSLLHYHSFTQQHGGLLPGVQIRVCSVITCASIQQCTFVLL